MFEIELLHTAIDEADFRALRADLEAFERVRPSADTWAIATDLQAQMVAKATTGQRVKSGDLLIAALAVERGFGVLHYDAAFDVIRERSGADFASEWIAPRGSLERPGQAMVSARKTYKKALGERLVQLRDDADLEVWPQLLEWLDDQLRERAIVPPPLPIVP